MTKTVGIVIFDDAEELDFVGPYEVFTMSNTVLERARDQHGDDRDGRDGLDVRLIARSGDIVTCAKGMQVVPHRSFADAPPLDVLLVPGGIGTRRLVNDADLLAWIDRAASPCEWVTSVCTGALLLAAAGPARGRRVTTHWLALDELRQRGEAGEVVEDQRYVRDGNLVTAAGVSAGIDMALWLVGQLYSPDHARATQRGMEYHPAPPYAEAA